MKYPILAAATVLLCAADFPPTILHDPLIMVMPAEMADAVALSLQPESTTTTVCDAPKPECHIVLVYAPNGLMINVNGYPNIHHPKALIEVGDGAYCLIALKDQCIISGRHLEAH